MIGRQDRGDSRDRHQDRGAGYRESPRRSRRADRRSDMIEMADRIGEKFAEAIPWEKKKEEVNEEEKKRKEVTDLQAVMRKSGLHKILKTDYLPDPKIVIEEAKRSGQSTHRAEKDSRIPVWVSGIEVDDSKWDPAYVSQDLKPEMLKDRHSRFRNPKEHPRTGEVLQNLMAWINTHVVLRSFSSEEALQILSIFARIWSAQGHSQAVEYLKTKIQKTRSMIMDGERVDVGERLMILEEKVTQDQAIARLQEKQTKMEIELKAARSAGKGGKKGPTGSATARRPWDPSKSQPTGSRGRDDPKARDDFAGMNVIPVRRTEYQKDRDSAKYICLNHHPARGDVCAGAQDGSCGNQHLDTRNQKDLEHYEKVQKAAQDTLEKRKKDQKKGRGRGSAR